METYLLNYNSGVQDSTCDYKQINTSFKVKNRYISEDGMPVLSGESLYAAFIKIEDTINLINNSPRPVSILKISIASVDEDNTTFALGIVTTPGTFCTLCPQVIAPGVNPVQFGPTESAWAIDNLPSGWTVPDPNSLNNRIASKINAVHTYALPSNYIIQNYSQGGMGGYIYNPAYNSPWWHGYMNVIMYNTNGEMNTYLNYYKSILDQNNPYGNGGVYVHSIRILGWNGWTMTPPGIPPTGEPIGSEIYCWHDMWAWEVQFLPYGGGTK